MTIHWGWDAIIVIAGVNLFVGVWAFISWFNNRRLPLRLPREQFLSNQSEMRTASKNKRAA